MSSDRIKPPSGEPAIRVVMMPRDTNAANTIFGGVLLSYIDQAGFAEARRQAKRRYVTVAMHEVKFHEPVFVGDVVSFHCRTTKIGQTSLTVCINVHAERFEGGDVVHVTEAEVVFVATDTNGTPIPVLS